MQHLARKGLLVAVASGALAAAAGGVAQAGSGADGAAAGSPGVGSGNAVQVPVDVPVNACGNSVAVVGLLNPAMGNACANVSPAETPPPAPMPPGTPRTRVMPPADLEKPVLPPPVGHPVAPVAPVARQAEAPAPSAPRLAETGVDTETSVMTAAGVAFLLGGAVLYRRAKPQRV